MLRPDFAEPHGAHRDVIAVSDELIAHYRGVLSGRLEVRCPLPEKLNASAALSSASATEAAPGTEENVRASKPASYRSRRGRGLSEAVGQ